MWKILRKTFPKKQKYFPLVKKNPHGRIVSSQEELKALYLERFRNILRHRKMRLGPYKKTHLCHKRLQLVGLDNLQQWTTIDIDRVLSSHKNNKSRDPHYLINEIFKPGVIGVDLKNTFLELLNLVRAHISFPEFMQLTNIVSI